MSVKKRLFIHGIRGIPAAHGGFETFIEKLAPYLVERGWDVTVYCQEHGTGGVYENIWNGVKLINIPVASDGAKGSIIFDWLTVKDATKHNGLNLTLGYNTALYSFLFRLKGKINIFNMDGIEWKRKKWSKVIKFWFFLNECFGSWLGNHLIADHPAISKHLQARVSSKKITVIPYGAESIQDAETSVLEQFGIEPKGYSLLVARPEPENSVKEIVEAYSRKKRKNPLIVLGSYTPEKNAYHKQVIEAAGEDVRFIGAIYDQSIVNPLRYHTRLYIHGHQVGGTNPSLVETIGAGAPVLAHDNHFNRWVAGEDAEYFKNANECAEKIDVFDVDDSGLEKMSRASRERHTEDFYWDNILSAYDKLLSDWHSRTQ